VNLTTPLHGSHLFRQAHIAANVETYIREGITIRPRTYNLDVPLSLYDCPLQEAAVASLCRATGSDPLVAARIVNLLCLLVLLAVFLHLMSRTGVPALAKALSLALFVYAPLDLFYFQTPLVDVLAETAAFGSLLAFVVWNETPAWPVFAVVVATAMVATLIKNPVELPVFVATVWLRGQTHGWRGLRTVSMAVYTLALGGAVVGFKLLANHVNGVSELISPWEEGQYFGSPAQRISPEAWWPVLRTLGLLILNPVTLGLAVVGAALWFARSRSRRRSVFGGLALGSALTAVVFLSRYRVHNYYLLPLAFPAAFFAAHALHFGRVLLRARRRAGRRPPRAWMTAVPALVLLGSLAFAFRGYAELAEADPTKQARGEWVKANTSANDFVVWVVNGDDDNWNPAFLYFAKRNGQNLNRSHLDRATLAALYRRFASGDRRVILFCADRDAADRVEAMGAAPIAAERARRLYLLEPSWLVSAP
jgi:hypothetical protein